MVHWQHGLDLILDIFTLKDEVGTAFLEKLRSGNPYSQYYVVQLFMPQLPEVLSPSYRVLSCIQHISKSIIEGDNVVREALIQNIWGLPDDWQKKLAENLKDITDENNPATYLADGTPFLKSNEPLPSNDSESFPF